MLRIYWKGTDTFPIQHHQLVKRIDGGWWISDLDTYSVVERISINGFILELLLPLEGVPQPPYWEEAPQSWTLHRVDEVAEAWSLGEQRMIQISPRVVQQVAQSVQQASQQTHQQPSQFLQLPLSQVQVPSWVLQEVELPSNYIDSALKTIQSLLLHENQADPLMPAQQPLKQKAMSREQTVSHSQHGQKMQKTPPQTSTFSSPLKLDVKPSQQPLIPTVPSPFPKGVQVGKLCQPTCLPEKRVPRKSPSHLPKSQPHKQQVPQCQIVQD